MSFSFPQQFDNRHETHAGFSAIHLAAFRNHAESEDATYVQGQPGRSGLCLFVDIDGHSKMLTKQCSRLTVSRLFTSRAYTAALP